LYADKLNAHDPDLVQLDDRTENGGTTTTMLRELRTSADVRGAVAGADILVIETGLNDLDETGALEKVAAGACGGPDGNRCLRAMGERWNRHFESIARTVDRLRAGKPTALRLVTSQNVFVSDPSIVTDHGLPDDFALTGGRLLTRMLTTAICRTAHHHGGQCIDVALLFNGPHDDQPRDENTPESMNLVAQALFDTGLPELELDMATQPSRSCVTSAPARRGRRTPGIPVRLANGPAPRGSVRGKVRVRHSMI
jgi:hypothetical protein